MVLTRITRMVSTTVGCWYFPESEATTTFKRTEQHKRPTLFPIYLHWCVHPFWKYWEQPNMTVKLVDNKQDKPNNQIWRWTWLMTNKINQATKYDGGIGDNKQDKPNNQIWRRNWWCGITLLSSSYSISTKLSRHLHVYATEPDERVLVCGCCGIVCKTGFSFPSSVQLWDWMHCGITNGTATKNNQRVWSCLLWSNQRVWFACCEITFSSASCWDNGAWRERLLSDWFGWCWRCFMAAEWQTVLDTQWDNTVWQTSPGKDAPQFSVETFSLLTRRWDWVSHSHISSPCRSKVTLQCEMIQFLMRIIASSSICHLTRESVSGQLAQTFFNPTRADLIVLSSRWFQESKLVYFPTHPLLVRIISDNNIFGNHQLHPHPHHQQYCWERFGQ